MHGLGVPDLHHAGCRQPGGHVNARGATQEVGIGKQQSLDIMLGLGTWASAHFAMGLAANAEHHVQHSSAEPDPNAHGVCCLEGLPIDRLG